MAPSFLLRRSALALSRRAIAKKPYTPRTFTNSIARRKLSLVLPVKGLGKIINDGRREWEIG